MATDSMTTMDGRRKGEESDSDWLRETVRRLIHEVMEAEVQAQIGARRYERSEDRGTYRNGYRPRTWDTRLGTLELAIPKLRTGSYFPTFLEPRRRAERALVSVVAEAYVQGVSTRKVEALVQALGAECDLGNSVVPTTGPHDWTCGHIRPAGRGDQADSCAQGVRATVTRPGNHPRGRAP